MQASALPRLDVHAIVVAADVDTVWRALLETVDRSSSHTGAGAYARLVGCADTVPSGPRPLAEGATLPGFHVVAADPGQALVMEGRHRFSDYALVFRVEELGAGRTRLHAESRAVFPGATGSLYRLLVIGSRGHVVAVRHFLGSVRRRAEAATRAEDRPRTGK